MLTSSVAKHSKMTCFWFSLEKNFKKSKTEMENLLSTLLEVAKEHAPSVILLEEFDSLGRKRTSTESEQDRRMKNSFYKLMDEINRCPEWISVFATTSIPWDLDVAALRRFQRKILVPMPNKEERIAIIKIHAGSNHTLTDRDLDLLGKMTEGFSGSDLSIIVNEALMKPIKEVSSVDEFVKVPRAKINEYDCKMGIKVNEPSYESESSFVWIPKIEGHPLLETSSLEAEVKKVSCLAEDPSISENIFIRNPEF
jgi:vacuolar protein-sorting-associated protein 4